MSLARDIRASRLDDGPPEPADLTSQRKMWQQRDWRFGVTAGMSATVTAACASSLRVPRDFLYRACTMSRCGPGEWSDVLGGSYSKPWRR
jgi:hypothetical protein